MSRFIALIILNYNNYIDTINCINSILSHNTEPIKIIVVDNSSTDQVVVPSLDRFFRELFPNDYQVLSDKSICRYPLPRLTFFLNNENVGYARGNNIGLNIAYSDSEIDKLVVLNNDILFTADILDGLRKQYDKLDSPAFITPLLYKKDGKSIDYGCARLNHTNRDILLNLFLFDKPWFGIKQRLAESRYLLFNHPELLMCEYVSIEVPVGAFMMVDKELMRSIGGFDPHTFLYYEENILFKKIQGLKKHNYLIPSLSCIHIGAASTSTNTPKVCSPSLHSLKHYVKEYAEMNFVQKCVFYVLFYLNALMHKLFESFRINTKS